MGPNCITVSNVSIKSKNTIHANTPSAMLCSGRVVESALATAFWNDARTIAVVPRLTALQGKLMVILMDTSKLSHDFGIEVEESLQYDALKRILAVAESQIVAIQQHFDVLKGIQCHLCRLLD